MAMYQIHEASALSGVSVRTLHYYDQIGLLSPHKQENGYRLYTEEDMDRLQKIMYYKYLGFSLNAIRDLLSGQDDEVGQLEKQLELLKDEHKRLRILIQTLEKSIEAKKGGTKMPTEGKFKGFSRESQEQYRDEAIGKYGEEVILESERRQAGREEEMVDGMNSVFFAFAENKKAGMPPDDAANTELAGKLHQLIRKYSFDCTLDVFGKIGLTYVNDPRFEKNIDQFGDGVARYACDAIQAYVGSENGQN